jgi:hypothetical protein
MNFRYEAFDRLARVTAGTLEAPSQEDATAALRAKGLYVQKIESDSTNPMKTVLPGNVSEVTTQVSQSQGLPAGGIPPAAPSPSAAAGPSKAWQDDLVTEVVGVSNVLRFLDTIRDDPGVNIGKKTREMLAAENLSKIGELAIAAAVSKAARKAT